MPLATSTPHVVKGFEGDYLDDDDDLEAIMAQISATQEAQLIKEAIQVPQAPKKSSSRSLFSDHSGEEVREFKPSSKPIQASKSNEISQKNKTSSVGCSRLENEPGPSWRNSRNNQTVTCTNKKLENIQTNSTKVPEQKEIMPTTATNTNIKSSSSIGSKLSISKARPMLSDPMLVSNSSTNQVESASNITKPLQTAIVPPQNITTREPRVIETPKPSQPSTSTKPSIKQVMSLQLQFNQVSVHILYIGIIT